MATVEEIKNYFKSIVNELEINLTSTHNKKPIMKDLTLDKNFKTYNKANKLFFSINNQ